MASKLERMIQPGERVVFRTRMSWRHFLGLLVKFAPVVVGIGVLEFWYSGRPSIFLGVLCGAVLLGVWIYGNEAVVTDRRVLHKTRHSVTEIPFWHIQELVRVTEYYGTLRDRSGLEVHLQFVPDFEGLAEAIVAQAGVPAPKPARGRVRSWGVFGTYFAISCGFVMVFLSYVAFDQVLFDGLDIGLFLLFFPVYLFGLPFALVIGFMVGQMSLVPVMRLFLGVEEARTFFNLVEENTADKRNWAAFVNYVPYRFARCFASLLYGARL